MAKGGPGTGSGIPLRDRVRANHAPEPRREPDTEPYPGRHCWVAAAVDGTRPRPGLLLEWRKTGHRWEGRVVYVAQLRAGTWATVEEWVAAELLTRADS